MKQEEIDALAGIVRTGLARDDIPGRTALDFLLSLIEPDRKNLTASEVADAKAAGFAELKKKCDTVTLWPWMSR